MNIGGVVVIYVIIWWLAFFVLLPMGVVSRQEAGEDDVKGAEPGAPVDPDLKRKALRASIISLIATIVICAIILSGVIDFRE